MNYLVICYLLFSLALLLNVQFSTLAYFRFQPKYVLTFNSLLHYCLLQRHTHRCAAVGETPTDVMSCSS